MNDASDVHEAEQVQADFTFLRQISQGVNVRLSDPLQIPENDGHANLLASSNQKGLLFASTNEGFLLHPLKDLRQEFKNAKRDTIPTLKPLRSIITKSNVDLGERVTFLRIADSDQSLIVGLANGRIAIWSIEALQNNDTISPSFILQPPSPDLILREVAPNPSDRPEICAVILTKKDEITKQSGSVAILNLRTGVWQGEITSPDNVPVTSISWSVKGKQLALGLENGQIAQITPEGELKSTLPKATHLSGDYYVDNILWLENNVFFVTYNSPQTTEEPEHAYEIYALIRDTSANNKITFVHFDDPAPAFGDTSRRGHRYVSWLKAWQPMKHMLFMANTSSTDIGLLGCSTEKTGQSAWEVLELEDTSRPALPFSSLDKSKDTSPIGLEMDVTSEDAVDDPQAAARGEDGEGKLPAVPILLVYTNDGVLLAYHVINASQSAGKYTHMVTPDQQSKTSDSAMTTSTMSEGSNSATIPQSSASQTGQPAFGQSTSFGFSQNSVANQKPSFGSGSGFGQTSAFGSGSGFGQPSTFGSGSGFGQTSAFGSGSIGSQSGSSTPSFGQSAQIGVKPSSAFSAFSNSGSSTPVSGGFGAFASKGNGTGFGASIASEKEKVATEQKKEETSKGFSTSAFGQPSAFGAQNTPSFSFGSSNSTASSNNSSSPFSTGSAFGSSSSNAFATKSAGGFGAFAADSSQKPFSFASATPAKAPQEEKKDLPELVSAFSGLSKEADEAKAVETMPNIVKEAASSATTEKIAKPEEATKAEEIKKPEEVTKAEEIKKLEGVSDLKEITKPEEVNISEETKKPEENNKSEEIKKLEEITKPEETKMPEEITKTEENKKSEEIASAPKVTVTSEKVSEEDKQAAHDSKLSKSADEKKEDSSFLNFINRAPRSSSPLSGAPVNRADLPQPGFKPNNTFGSENGAIPGGNAFSFAPKDASKPASPAFSFATSAPKSEQPSQQLPSFTATPVQEKEGTAQKPAFSFATSSGSKSEQPSQQASSFSAIPNQNKEPIAAQKPPAFSFGSSSAPKNEKPLQQSSPFSAAPVQIKKDSAAQKPTFSFASSKPVVPNEGTKEPFKGFSFTPTPTTPKKEEEKPKQSTTPISSPFVSKTDNKPKATVEPVAPAKPFSAPVAKASEPKSSPISNPPKFSVPAVDSTKSSDVRGQGLQEVFLQTYLTMEKELDVLKQNVESCAKFQSRIRKSNNDLIEAEDLGNPGLWTFGELEVKSKIAQNLLTELNQINESFKRDEFSVKQLRAEQVKVELKQEEIERFLRAKSDPEFGKMIKVRQLGPEHTENQHKLRRGILDLREAISYFDEQLEMIRRSVVNARLGKAKPMEVPSIDRINRSVRNITRSAEAKLLELEALELTYESLFNTRSNLEVRELNGLSSLSLGGLGDDSFSFADNSFPSMLNVASHLPNSSIKRDYDSAAYRAYERHKQTDKIRDIFLKARKEPVLNTKMRRHNGELKQEKAFEASDLDMVFAKGTVNLDENRQERMTAAREKEEAERIAKLNKEALEAEKMKKAADNERAKAELQASEFAKSYASLQQTGPKFEPTPFTAAEAKGNAKGTSAPSLNFAATLPPGALDFSSSASFAPRSTSSNEFLPGQNSIGRTHHNSSKSSKRQPAVTLQAQQISETPSTFKADFFAMPSLQNDGKKTETDAKAINFTSNPVQTQNDAKANAKAFGFGAWSPPSQPRNEIKNGFSFGMNNNNNPSFSSFSNSATGASSSATTFKGLQGLQPISKDKSSSSSCATASTQSFSFARPSGRSSMDDVDDDEEEEDDEEEDEDEDGENDDYEEDDDDPDYSDVDEEDDEEEGLSAVSEGDEEEE